MKSEKFDKKLVLNKRTIATLNFVERKKVLAGDDGCCTAAQTACTQIRPCSMIKTCIKTCPEEPV
jgi:hypothetical protein